MARMAADSEVPTRVPSASTTEGCPALEEPLVPLWALGPSGADAMSTWAGKSRVKEMGMTGHKLSRGGVGGQVACSVNVM